MPTDPWFDNPLDKMPIATNDYGECVDTLLDSMNESDTNW